MTTPETESQMKASAVFRNIFLAVGLIVFPLLLVLLCKFGDYPESRKLLVLGVPALGSILSLFGAAFMHLHRRSLALGKHQATTKQDGAEKRKGASIGEYLIFLSIVPVVVIGAALLFHDVKKSGIAEDMANPSAAFIMSAAKPAEAMVEIMHKPVRRAVLIPATEEGPYKGVVCAETDSGTLELYGFGIMRGIETFDQIKMNADLEAAAPAFCDAAYAQLN